MRIITVYKVAETYRLEPEGASGVPVRVELAEGVRFGRSPRGTLVVYPPRFSYGIPLKLALVGNWCSLIDPVAR